MRDPRWRQTRARSLGAKMGKRLFIAHAMTDDKFSMLISQQISSISLRLHDSQITFYEFQSQRASSAAVDDASKHFRPTTLVLVLSLILQFPIH